VLAGSIVDVHRPGTFVAIYLGNALSFLAPFAVLVGPLRHVSGKVARPVTEQDGLPVRASYLEVLRDKAMLPVIALTFLSAFVGYAQTEAGFTAYARLAGAVSTRTIGYAFAANTATIVLLQLLVLQRIEGRRRTRVILVLSAVWAVSWLMTGLCSLSPGSGAAATLVICAMAVFALGETLLQPTIPAITNDLSPDHLRGRYNAVMAGAFQLAAVTGPVVAGVMLGARFNVEFIAMLIAGCALMAFIALAVERRIPDQANGITSPAVGLSRA
jgi:MFS family permease